MSKIIDPRAKIEIEYEIKKTGETFTLEQKRKTTKYTTQGLIIISIPIIALIILISLLISKKTQQQKKQKINELK